MSDAHGLSIPVDQDDLEIVRQRHIAAAKPRARITPEMIQAGVSALLDFDHDFESEKSAVARIFSAMWLAERGLE